VGGIPVQVLDTAGIREAVDQVEQIGVERSRAVAQTADLVLLTLDAEVGWTEADQQIYEQVKHRPLIAVLNKIDRVAEPPQIPISPVVETAAAHSQGIEALEQAILAQVMQGKLQAADVDLAINQRQAAALIRAKAALEQVQQTAEHKLPLDFWTIDLRSAIQALGEITGEEMVEQALDQIFSKFCIGK
jgi:tRNA modification GTPase